MVYKQYNENRQKNQFLSHSVTFLVPCKQCK